jgi:hypothetical protein
MYQIPSASPFSDLKQKSAMTQQRGVNTMQEVFCGQRWLFSEDAVSDGPRCLFEFREGFAMKAMMLTHTGPIATRPLELREATPNRRREVR